MTRITLYHNPHFLAYDGDHARIPPPTQPTAFLNLADGLSTQELLVDAFAHTQHGFAYPSWFLDPAVMPCLRSTSVGDLLALPDGRLYVVETIGFQPYQPRALLPVHQLAAAYRQLAAAAKQRRDAPLRQAVESSLAAMQRAVKAAGPPPPESPILWDKAKVGDRIPDPASSDGHYLVVARKVAPKWRAQRLAAAIPNAQVWIDSARSWAVMLPVAGSLMETDA
jgi:hypothetical protein